MIDQKQDYSVGEEHQQTAGVKCETIAKDIGCSVGDCVVKKIENAVEPKLHVIRQNNT